MASPNADRQELQTVQRRISEVMRDCAAKQEERQDMLNTIEHVSRANIQLLSATASSSKSRRGHEAPPSMDTTIEHLQMQVAEKDAVIGRLWNKLAELQERERELEAKSRGY